MKESNSYASIKVGHSRSSVLFTKYSVFGMVYNIRIRIRIRIFIFLHPLYTVITDFIYTIITDTYEYNSMINNGGSDLRNCCYMLC